MARAPRSLRAPDVARAVACLLARSRPHHHHLRNISVSISIMPQPPSIVLFDGECNVCDSFVNFVIDRDHERRLVFTSLQSPAGQRLLAFHGVPQDLDSMVLIEHGQTAFVKTSAVLRTLGSLGFPWVLLLLLLVIPACVRDVFYSAFAARRYQWFGHKTEACRRMTPELRARFLPEDYQPADAVVSPSRTKDS